MRALNGNLSALSRQELLRGIQMACFAVKEAQLFLDTHPTNKDAMEYFNKYNKKKMELTAEYNKRFGPICLTNYESGGETWEWVKGPWPWEAEV